jgi:cytoskeletal protein RodZ
VRKFYDTVLDGFGRPVLGASITVTTYPLGVAAVLYSDNGVTPTGGNVVLTDANGYYEFYVASGRYTLVTTTTSDTKTVNDVSIGAGAPIQGSVSYDPPNLTTGSFASTTVTVTGAALGDFAQASFSLSTQGIEVTAEVTATDTVTVTFKNDTGGTINLASGTLRATVTKAT